MNQEDRVRAAVILTRHQLHGDTDYAFLLFCLLHSSGHSAPVFGKHSEILSLISRSDRPRAILTKSLPACNDLLVHHLSPVIVQFWYGTIFFFFEEDLLIRVICIFFMFTLYLTHINLKMLRERMENALPAGRQETFRVSPVREH